MSKTTDKINELQRLLGDTSPIVSDVLTLALREITKLSLVEPVTAKPAMAKAKDQKDKKNAAVQEMIDDTPARF